MEHSVELNEIAAALAKAQAKIRNAEKTAENPGFKRGNRASTYADLASIWDACREHLTANGIAVVQGPKTEGPMVSVETMLVHSSGQWFKDNLTAAAASAGAQHVGSAITYLRRYALAAMVGVAPADDDGEAAMGRDTPAGRPEPATRAESVKAKVAAKVGNGGTHPVPGDSIARRADLFSRMREMGIPGAKMAEQLGEWLGHVVDKSTEFSSEDWSRADAAITQARAAAETLARAKSNIEAAFGSQQ
jgi:hypothetical protein